MEIQFEKMVDYKLEILLQSLLLIFKKIHTQKNDKNIIFIDEGNNKGKILFEAISIVKELKISHPFFINVIKKGINIFSLNSYYSTFFIILSLKMSLIVVELIKNFQEVNFIKYLTKIEEGILIILKNNKITLEEKYIINNLQKFVNLEEYLNLIIEKNILNKNFIKFNHKMINVKNSNKQIFSGYSFILSNNHTNLSLFLNNYHFNNNNEFYFKSEIVLIETYDSYFNDLLKNNFNSKIQNFIKLFNEKHFLIISNCIFNDIEITEFISKKIYVIGNFPVKNIRELSKYLNIPIIDNIKCFEKKMLSFYEEFSKEIFKIKIFESRSYNENQTNNKNFYNKNKNTLYYISFIIKNDICNENNFFTIINNCYSENIFEKSKVNFKKNIEKLKKFLSFKKGLLGVGIIENIISKEFEKKSIKYSSKNYLKYQIYQLVHQVFYDIYEILLLNEGHSLKEILENKIKNQIFYDEYKWKKYLIQHSFRLIKENFSIKIYFRE